MKNKKIEIITIIVLLVVIIICVVFVILQKTKISSYKEDVDSYKEKVSTLEKQLGNKQNEESREYDCSFTRTYRVIDSIDYPLASDGLSYIVVDDYHDTLYRFALKFDLFADASNMVTSTTARPRPAPLSSAASLAACILHPPRPLRQTCCVL